MQREVGHKRVVCGNRREDVVISHLRIGHTALSHSLNSIGKREVYVITVKNRDSTFCSV